MTLTETKIETFNTAIFFPAGYTTTNKLDSV